MLQAVLTVVLIGFSALSAMALWHHGYWGILAPHFETWGGAQVLCDLVIALGLFLLWLWRDARTQGRNPWPWIALTLVTGSIGALLYLVTARR